MGLIRPLIPPAKQGGNKRTVDECEVVNGLMDILSTGCQRAQLPKDLPPRSTVNASLVDPACTDALVLTPSPRCPSSPASSAATGRAR